MGWVSGTVYQPDGKTPVGEGVKVTVNFGGGVTLTTSPTGTFLSGQIIPAGNYCLTAEDPVTTLKGRSCVYVPTGQKVIHDHQAARPGQRCTSGPLPRAEKSLRA